MTTIIASLRTACVQLDGSSARLEAELLLCHALQRPRSFLYSHGDDELDAEIAERFAADIALRVEGWPLAYLIGRREFHGITLSVNAAVLIPRPETELLVDLALAAMADTVRPRVLDLGTGSGAIALALAHVRHDAQVTAVDASIDALVIAQANAAALQLASVRFLFGDWWAPVRGRQFDVVVSNPPYIAENDPHLAQGDLRFEPQLALASGPDGLDAIRCIATAAPRHLVDGGRLLIEHGHEQGADVRGLFALAGFVDIVTERDLEGRERVTGGKFMSA